METGHLSRLPRLRLPHHPGRPHGQQIELTSRRARQLPIYDIFDRPIRPAARAQDAESERPEGGL